MAKKRKIESESSQLPQEIEQQEEKIMAEEEEEEEEEFVEYEEEVEEEEEEEDPEELEGEEAEEFVEEEEEEEEEEEGKEKESDEEEEEEEKDEEEEEREPIESVISAFNKEALITLLSEAAERHPDVAARVRAMADVDPAQRKIFVHGLNWETTSEMLMEEFLKFGEIEECRLVANKAGRCKGYGFILFKTGRAARQALKEPQKVINNRITSCQLASVGPVAAPLEPQQQQQQQQQPSEYTRRKIYVSNVGAELDPMKLKDFFSKYGEIEEGPLGLDKETGKPKGFCLFVYKTVESAKWALEEPHKQFEGVTLHCQKAIDGPKSQKTQIVHHMKPHTNQHFVDNVAPSVVGSTVMPAPAQAPPLWQQQQVLNVDPAALGQALTALMMAQGAGFNGSFGAVGASTGMLNHPAVVPGFGGQVVQGGYGSSIVGPGGGLNMGFDGMGGYGNQGGYPVRQKRRRGSGR